jgi:hypothetical protein
LLPSTPTESKLAEDLFHKLSAFCHKPCFRPTKEIKSDNLCLSTNNTMTNYSNSPFDVALARPFLDEPTRKKWSINLPPKPSASWLHPRSGGNKDPSNMSSPSSGGNFETITFESHIEGDEEDRPLLQQSTSSSVAPVPLVPSVPQQENGSWMGLNNAMIPPAHHGSTSILTCTDQSPFDELGNTFINMTGGSLLKAQVNRVPSASPPRDKESGGSPTSRASLSPRTAVLSHPLQREQRHRDFSDELDSDDEMMMELIPLNSPSPQEEEEEEEGTNSRDIELGAAVLGGHTMIMSPLRSTLDGDIAIMTEREVELSNIASSMRQIHTIQKGLFPGCLLSSNSPSSSNLW